MNIAINNVYTIVILLLIVYKRTHLYLSDLHSYAAGCSMPPLEHILKDSASWIDPYILMRFPISNDKQHIILHVHGKHGKLI